MIAEFSCGGVVLHGRRVLMVLVKNLRSKKVWTFPKGHVEPREGCRHAAIREVLEETGYACRIQYPMLRVRYFFSTGTELIRKTVQWYLMDKIEKIGKPDPKEILAVRWVTLDQAKTMVRYPSDKKLLYMATSIAAAAAQAKAAAQKNAET